MGRIHHTLRTDRSEALRSFRCAIVVTLSLLSDHSKLALVGTPDVLTRAQRKPITLV